MAVNQMGKNMGCRNHGIFYQLLQLFSSEWDKMGLTLKWPKCARRQLLQLF